MVKTCQRMEKLEQKDKEQKDKMLDLIPSVSKKDLEAAQKTLEDSAEKKRQRASMTHWLESKKIKKLYDKKGYEFKKQFLEKWLLS